MIKIIKNTILQIRFTQNVISIRTGKLFDKSYLTYGQMDSRYTEWNYILIEGIKYLLDELFDLKYFKS